MKYPGLLQLAALAIVAALLPMAERLMDSAPGVLGALMAIGTAAILAHLGDTNKKAAHRAGTSESGK